MLAAVAGLGTDVELIEVDLLDPTTPSEFKVYPSPTVLVDGKDVSPSAGGVHGISCRASGAPSTEDIRAAMDEAWGRE